MLLPISCRLEAADCVNSWKSVLHGVVRDRTGVAMRYLPISNGVIADSNILSYVVNTDGRRREDVERIVARIAKLRKISQKKHGEFHFYVTDTTARELAVASGPERTGFAFPAGTRRVRVGVERDSADYRSVVEQLERLGLGQSSKQSGLADRQIVADALFADTSRGQVPTIWTADRGLYMPLCRLSPTCQRAIAKGTVVQDLSDGFEIEIRAGSEIRKLRILPFFGRNN